LYFFFLDSEIELDSISFCKGLLREMRDLGYEGEANPIKPKINLENNKK
jgi:hypothetical protein